MSTPIAGYRTLTEAETRLINEIKAKGGEIEDLVLKVQDHLLKQAAAARRDFALSDDVRRLELAQPSRWTAIARTDFQTALMALVRAVAQPSNF